MQHYILPVLRATSYLHIMEPMGQNQRRRSFVNFAMPRTNLQCRGLNTCCHLAGAKRTSGRQGTDATIILLLARLMGQYCLALWRLSASVVHCNAAAAGRVGGWPPPGAWAVRRPTLHGGPVRLRPVRATPCYNLQSESYIYHMHTGHCSA